MAPKPKILFIIWPFIKRFVDASLDRQQLKQWIWQILWQEKQRALWEYISGDLTKFQKEMMFKLRPEEWVGVNQIRNDKSNRKKYSR